MSNPISKESEVGKHQLSNLFDDLRSRKQIEVDQSIIWYKNNRDRPLAFFRVAGTIIIFASVSLPVIVQLDFPIKDQLVAVVSVLIAVLTSLNSFYQWQSTWQSRTITYKTLMELQGKWELEMLKAKHNADIDQAKENAINATEALISEASQVTSGETKSFFKSLKFPS